MSEIDISTLPISKIRNELKNIGLYASGTKKELIERYNAYWEEKKKTNPIETQPAEESTTEVKEVIDFIPTEVPEETPAVTEEPPVEEPVVTEEPEVTEDVSTEMKEIEEVIEEATAVSNEIPAQSNDEFDIEVELDRRQSRAAKFNASFDREATRRKIMREHGMHVQSDSNTIIPSDISMSEEVLAARRNKFGIVEKDMRQQRKERFAAPTDVPSDEVRAARQQKFGIVEEIPKRKEGFGSLDTMNVRMPRRQNVKRQNVPYGFRKNRRYYYRVLKKQTISHFSYSNIIYNQMESQ